MKMFSQNLAACFVIIPLCYSNFCSAEASGYFIEEVIVTAQKQAENIRDVPISITALNEDFLNEAGITDVGELSRAVPNLVINASPYTGYVAMRGLGSGNNKGFERSVALVIDGVYYGRQDYLFEALADAQRIEVLRGPQGTLFGKNAIAGALNVTTGQATPEFTGSVSVMGGELDRQRLRIAAGGSLIDDVLNVRIAWDEDVYDGVIRNTTFLQSVEDNPDRGDIDRMLRNRDNHIGRVRLSAPNLIDGLDLNFTATHASVFGNSTGSELSVATDATLAVYRRYDPATEATPNRQTAINNNEATVRKGDGYSLQFDYELGEYVLTGIWGHSDFTKISLLDGDFGPLDAIVSAGQDRYEQSSAELRIASPLGWFEYVAGLYYFESDFVGNGQVVLNPQRILEIAAQHSAGIPTNIGGLPIALPPNLPLGVANQHINNDRFFDQRTESVALFGQATLNIKDNLALILGMRYSEESKNADMILSNNNAFSSVFFNTFLNEVAYDESRSRKEADFSPKLSVRYEINDEITAYATWATAFKAGGFNEQAVDNTNLEFEPEEAVTWEAGAKMRLLDGAATLNASVFYTDFDNLQVSLFNGTNFVVGNAASAVSQGAELEGQLLPSDWLSLGGTIAYLDARYKEFSSGQCVATSGEEACDLSGRELTRAPEWEISFNPRLSISKLFSWVGNSIPAQIGLGLDMTYRAQQYFSTDLDPLDQQKGYTDINGNVRIAGKNDDWSIIFSVKNLNDKLVQSHGQDVPLQAGSHFGAFEAGRRYFAEIQYQW